MAESMEGITSPEAATVVSIESEESVPNEAEKESSERNSELYTCYQCNQSYASEPHCFILQCLHTACRNCLDLHTASKPPSLEDYNCKCKQRSNRRKLLLVNKIYARRGRCQQTLTCKNPFKLFCSKCDVNICDEHAESHKDHQLAEPKTSPACDNHKNMPAKYTCSCGAILCHPCCTGASTHHTHQKKAQHPSARVVDTCDRFSKGMSTLENTTQATFNIFTQERNKLKNEFRQMKVDLVKNMVELINIFMRKMNDSVLAIEMFDASYTQKYEANAQEYNAKRESITKFKKLCANVADNDPSPDYLAFVTEVSQMISSEVTSYTNKTVEAIKAYSSPLEFLMDIKPVTESLNRNVRFQFHNQTLLPPPRSDHSLNIIDVPIANLVKNPLAEFSGGRHLGEKRPGGPLKDASDAKRSRPDLNILEAVGTSINHRILPPSSTSSVYPAVQSSKPIHVINAARPSPQAPITRYPRINPGRMPITVNPPHNLVNVQSTNFQVNRVFHPPTLNPRIRHPVDGRPVSTDYSSRLPNPLPQPRFLRPANSKVSTISGPLVDKPRQTGYIYPGIMRSPPIAQPHKVLSSVPATKPTLTSQHDINRMDMMASQKSPSKPKVSGETSAPKKPEKDEDWDDSCYICNQGYEDVKGDLVCCAQCPKVYHTSCHIPLINGEAKDLPDDWSGTCCKTIPPITEVTEKFTERERLVCSRILLACYEKLEDDNIRHVQRFHHLPPQSLKRYYETIKEPVCLEDIALRLSQNYYKKPKDFIEDMNLVFINCCVFNRKGTAIEVSARIIYGLYKRAVTQLLPPYASSVWEYTNSVKA